MVVLENVTFASRNLGTIKMQHTERLGVIVTMLEFIEELCIPLVT